MHPAFAAPPPQKPEWFKCKADVDCVEAKFFCGNTKAVNKKAVEDFKKWVASIKTQCQDSLKFPKVDRIYCDNGTCQMMFQHPEQ